MPDIFYRGLYPVPDIKCPHPFSFDECIFGAVSPLPGIGKRTPADLYIST